MKSQAQMSVLDGVLSIGVPTLSVLSGVLAHSVRVISVSLTGLENAMMISVEVLSAAVMLWWALGVILGVGYLLKVRAGSIRLHHREDRGTFLLPRYIRNTILTLGGAALGLSAAFAPAQAADAHPNISSPAISAPSQLSDSPAAHSASSSSEASVEILRPARQRMLHRGSQLQEPLKGYRLRTLRSTRLLPHLRRLLEPPLLLMSLLRARQYPSSSNVQVFHPTRSPMVRLRQTYLPNRRFPRQSSLKQNIRV